MARFTSWMVLVVGACSYTPPSAIGDDDDAASPTDSMSVEPDGPLPDGAPPDSPVATPTTSDHVTAADTWIQVNFPNTNNGAEVFVIADGNPLCVSLLRFDLSGIAGSQVSKVELHVFTNFDPGAEVGVFDLNESWSESQATWNQRANGQAWMAAGASPPSRDATALASFTPGASDSEFKVDLDPATVQAWVDDPAVNFGLAIASVNSDGPKFHSREAGNLRPFLRITHTP